MLLIVGLGNPGAEYAATRHNVGFLAVDEIVDTYNFSGPKKKFHGEVFEGEIEGVRVIALKPQTFMNRSGIAVAEAASFYKIAPENVIVLYDELDLVPGKLRVKQGGGDGGHNGIRSIDSHISNNFWRIRIGIGHPGDKNLVSGYVLSRFTAEEGEVVKNTVDAAAKAFPLIAAGTADKFMSKVALLVQNN